MGDFAVLKKKKEHQTERKEYEKKASGWLEREVDTVRIRIKTTENQENSEFSYCSVVKGDILPTVSSRDKRRAEANVWTSGNRIFKVSNPTLFLNCIDRLNGQGAEDAPTMSVKSFLDIVTGLEKKEYNNYLEWVYYEMERQIT
jgi:hypothetical protein